MIFLGGFFICINILKKVSCYHDNYFEYFAFRGKYNDFVSKARGSACMYFLVYYLLIKQSSILKFCVRLGTLLSGLHWNNIPMYTSPRSLANNLSQLTIFFRRSGFGSASKSGDKRIPREDLFKVRSAYNTEKLDKIC